MARYELRSRTPAKSPPPTARRGRKPKVQYEEHEAADAHEVLDHLVEQIGTPAGNAMHAGVAAIEDVVSWDALRAVLPCLLLVVTGILSAGYYWPDFIAFIEYMESLAVTEYTVGWLPRISVLDFAGSIAVCAAYRKVAAFPKHPVETLVACTLLQFGGTTLAHVFILGQAPSWVASHTAWPALALAWWLTFGCPMDLWYKHVASSKLLAYPLGVVTGISTAHAVTSWGMEKALSAHHPAAAASLLAAVLSGALSACGGGIMGDALSMTSKEWGFKHTPATLKAPTAAVQRAFLCSVVYYYLTNPHNYLQWPGAGFLSNGGLFGASKSSRADARAALALGIFVLQTVQYWLPEMDVFKPFHYMPRALNIQHRIHPHDKKHQ